MNTISGHKLIAVLDSGGGGGGNGGVGGGGTNSFSAGLRQQISTTIGLKPNLNSPGGIISSILPYLFVLAGFILLLMLIWGGFEILMGAAEPKSQEAGKQRITAAFIGFLLLFASIWMAQIAEIVFGINILHN